MRKISVFLCMVMMFLLVSCRQTEPEPGEKTVFYPEYFTVNGETEGRIHGFLLAGDNLYYSRAVYTEELKANQEVLYKYSLADGTTKGTWIKTSENSSFICYTADDAGNLYTVMDDRRAEESKILFRKYNAQEAVDGDRDITEMVHAIGENAYVSGICLDGQKNVYICVNSDEESAVLLLDRKGESLGIVEDLKKGMYQIRQGKDGRVYLCNFASAKLTFTAIDFAEKKLGDTYKNIPGVNNVSIAPEKDFLFRADSAVYEYELENESYQILFDWMDYNVTGNDVRYMGLTEDGEIVAVIGALDSDKVELVKMNRTKPVSSAVDVQEQSSVDEKEEIILGTVTIQDSQKLQNAVNAFNRESETHRITIKVYTENGVDSSTAITNVYKDIVSGTNCPDILDLSDLNMEKLASMGAVEDLTSYLEQSTLYSKEDFLENVIEGVTFDGKIVGIPTGFTLSTVVGKTSEVGEEMGWSLQEMIDFAKAHPNTKLFQNVTPDTFIYDFMRYNRDSFVDWTNKECHFDSSEFRALMELASQFPLETEWSSKVNPKQKQSGEILLEKVENVSDFYWLQQYPAMYGEAVTFIGFPTADGSVGCTMNLPDSLYGITSKSEHKEEAWAFIERYLTDSVEHLRKNLYHVYRFPVLKDVLQEQIDHLYLRDEKGELLLDDAGNPMPVMSGYNIGMEDWQYICPPPTEDDIALMLELISVAKPTNEFGGDDMQIVRIVSEEAAAYFNGQKTMDEVIDIIQNRAWIYVNENS